MDNNANSNPAHVKAPRATSNFVRCHVVLGSRNWQALLAQAFREQRSMSVIVEDALKDYLAKTKEG